MIRTLVIFLSAATLFAVDNPWDKVKELKSGTEIRIARRGLAQPLEAKLDEVRDDTVVVVVKNEQKAIRKDEIDRLDYRPKAAGRTIETKTTNTPADTTPPVGMSHGPQTPGQSTSTGISFNKPGYETIYRRLAPHSAGEAPPTKK